MLQTKLIFNSELQINKTLCWAVLLLSTVGAYLESTKAQTDQINGQSDAILTSPSGNVVAIAQHRTDPDSVDADSLWKAGKLHINTRNNTAWPSQSIDHITVIEIERSLKHQILAPFNTTLGWIRYSPNEHFLSYVVLRDTGVEQWVLDINSGIPRPLTSASLNATSGEPCQWLTNSTGMLCKFLRSARGAPPTTDTHSADTNTETFAYYFTSQLATIELSTGRRTNVGRPGFYEQATLSQDGKTILVIILREPGSTLMASFPESRLIEQWDHSGKVLLSVEAAQPQIVP